MIDVEQKYVLKKDGCYFYGHSNWGLSSKKPKLFTLAEANAELDKLTGHVLLDGTLRQQGWAAFPADENWRSNE